jgi:enoyl-CoA hydratase/carnithine racemase
MTDASPLLLRREGAVARLCLNRPARHHTLSRESWRAFPALLAEADAAEDVRVIVVQGATDDCFCAGIDPADLADLADRPDSARAMAAEAHAALAAFANLSKPSIALVRGPCLDGGCAIALACDIRFASASARFGIAATRIGLLPGFAELRLLVARVGPAHAADLIFSGREIAASDAERIGLVEDVWPDQAFNGAANDYLASVCATSPFAARGAKAMLRAIAEGAAAAPPRLREMAVQAFAGSDFRGAMERWRAPDPPPR